MYLVLRHEEWLVGTSPSTWHFGQLTHHLQKRWLPIGNIWIYSAMSTEILVQIDHFPRRYGRKQKWVFFIEVPCILAKTDPHSSHNSWAYCLVIEMVESVVVCVCIAWQALWCSCTSNQSWSRISTSTHKFVLVPLRLPLSFCVKVSSMLQWWVTVLDLCISCSFIVITLHEIWL